MGGMRKVFQAEGTLWAKLGRWGPWGIHFRIAGGLGQTPSIQIPALPFTSSRILAGFSTQFPYL